MDDIDPARVFEGPTGLSVYVPEIDFSDMTRDMPGVPPEVDYFGVKANYWVVLREDKMDYMGGEKRFTESEVAWLRSIRPQVENLLERPPTSS